MTQANSSHRAVVVAPTYNNDRTVVTILQRVYALGLPIIVVNDGSTDNTAGRLDAWHATQPTDDGAPVSRVVHHAGNRGKAAAMNTGFAEAHAMGFTHAVTIDTDLQHDPEDIPTLMQASIVQPTALVLGERRDDLANTPARSLVGRRWSNRAIFVECGLRITDSQSGLRVYPLSLVMRANCRAGFYGYETEIIVRAVWMGHPVARVPITSRYLPENERVSHFRPLTDTVRCMRVHLRLLPQSPWYRLRRPAEPR